MKSEKMVRQSKRTFLQRFFMDPIVAFFAVTVWGVFKLLPVHTASNMGAKLGSFAGFILKKRSHIGMVNLKIAFPEKSEEERKEILKKMWQHWGRFYAEMPHSKTLLKQAEFKGKENLNL